MTKMFYVCLHSYKRVERPSQPKLYSVSKLFRFRWAVFLQFTICETTKKEIQIDWGKLKLYYVRCWMTILFLYPFFAFCGKSKNKGEKVSRLWVSFLPLKWEALEMGPGARFQGINISRQATPISIGQPATVLYLRVIFQFIKLVGGSPLFTNIVIFQQT